MIKEIQENEIEKVLEVIRKSHNTVAEEFGLTQNNCPKHTSYIEENVLNYHFNNGFLMIGYYKDKNIIGYVSLSNKDKEIFEIHNLSILPNYRHFGYGKELINYCINKVKKIGGKKIIIGIINENAKLKNWYMQYGFVQTSIVQYNHLPFNVCNMEIKLNA